jgi:peptidoglycan hydrolase-like protein with peptidoglycan-binding domain
VSAREIAEAATLRILELSADQIRANAVRTVVSGAPPPQLKQRGRTGAAAFQPGKHARGPGGKFAFEGGRGAHAAKTPKSPQEIKQFQKEYALPQTGKMDAATRATVASPPPQSVGQLAKSEAAKKAKAEATKRQESRAKTNAKRKEEGKPPVGTKATGASSRSASGTSTGGTGTGSSRSTSRSGSSRSSSSSAAARTEAAAEAAERKGATARHAIGKAMSGISWTGRLNVNENLQVGKGMEKGQPPSPAVGLLQAKLVNLGFNVGSTGVDGKFGPATQMAIKILQREYGIKPTGIVESATLQLLETLTERAQKWQKHGIIAAAIVPGETFAAQTRRVLAVLS